MNDQPSVNLETRTGEGLTLRVAFAWCEGRWGHTVEVLRAGEPLWVLPSIEGNAEQDFPPSPPLQQLHRTDLPDGRTALLLIGMAGRSHWSVSCETEPGRARILFDVACRAVAACRTTLGSSYQLGAVMPTSVSESGVGWPLEAHRVLLRGLPAAPDTLPCSLSVEDGCLAIRPAVREPVPIRWRYELVLERE